MNVYPLNQHVVCEFTFKGTDELPVDPATATMTVRHPDGTIDTYDLAEATRASEGVYTITVVADAEGRWFYRGIGENGVFAAEQGFRVEPSAFV